MNLSDMYEKATQKENQHKRQAQKKKKPKKQHQQLTLDFKCVGTWQQVVVRQLNNVSSFTHYYIM